MPLYDFKCEVCGKVKEVLLPQGNTICCGQEMTKLFPTSISYLIKDGYPLWIDRMDDIHKAQADKGERFRYVHPREIL